MYRSAFQQFAITLLACLAAPLIFADEPIAPKPVASNRVAGKVLVKLRATAPELPSKEEGSLRWTRQKQADDEHPLHGTLRRIEVRDGRKLFPQRERAAKHPGRRAIHDRPEAKPLERWYQLDLPEDADLDAVIEELRGSNLVEVAEPVIEYRLSNDIPTPITGLPDGTTDPGYGQQWYHANAYVEAGWNHLKESGVNPGGTPHVVVAVIDSGVDASHPDLVGNMWINNAEIPGNGIDDDGNGFIDDIHGCNVVGAPESHSGDSSDFHGHGTHVAGIIASTAFNGIGGVGVAFNTRIMAVRAAQYSGVITSQDAAEGIVYAVENGADVINMSFGGYGRSQMIEDVLAVALNQAVLCAAAGNDTRSDIPMYPAGLPYVIGVMATDPTLNLAWFSNRNPEPPRPPWYEISAPGTSIYSTLPNNSWAGWSGTSMATPVVSGVAALMRSYFWQRDIYSSRFLMGSIVHSKSFNGGVVHAYKALTEPPKPGVDLYANWLFDDASIHPDNDGDGRIDAGETVHIGIELINRSGQANNVVATLRARAQGTVMDDPYVTITTDTVSYQDMGPFNMADNGFIYNAGGVLVGVSNPFVVTVSEDCPNDHVIPFVLTTNFYDGWDPENTETYIRVSRFSMIVQRGRDVPTVIPSGETVTLDGGNLWIVGGPVLVEAGATLRITEGAQVQWGAVSSDPYNPGPKSGYVIVRGVMSVEGSSEAPVWLHPSYLVSGQQTKITVESGGVCDMQYVRIQNPFISGIRTIDHGYLYWDAFQTEIGVAHVSNTVFSKFRGGGNMNLGRVETCLFDAGWLSSGTVRRNCVFLQDNENNKPLTVTAPLSFNTPLTDDKGVLDVFHGATARDGETYVVLPMERVSLRLAETIASFFGGHVASVRNEAESDFLKNYLPTVANFRAHGSGNHDWVYIGLSDRDEFGVYSWLDGEETTFTDWAGGFPTVLNTGTEQLVQFVDIYNNGLTRIWGWRNVNESNSIRTGHGDRASWKSFVLRLPGEWTTAQLNEVVANGQMLAHVRQTFESHWKHNAFLSKYWDPAVTNWMRVSGQANLSTGYSILRENYWGTANPVLIDHMIIDYYDNFTSARIDYLPAPAQGFESTWPFVQGVEINSMPAESVPTLNTGPATFTVSFNRDMDPEVVPFVTFGPSKPFTDFTVKPVETALNGWLDARTWQGTFYIVPVTGDGYHQMRISGGVAADDPWLVSGYDVGRFRFNVETMGVAAMTLQAEGREGAIQLAWQQNDYELIGGYNLYRSATPGGTYTRLNTTIIPVGQEWYSDTAVTPGVPMYYKFTVGLSDYTESAFTNIASAAAIDTIAPAISHVPVSSAPPGAGVRITANITDNLMVQGATLHYRAWGDSAPPAQLAMLNLQGNEWTATIPGAAVLPPGVEYFISATDGVSTTFKGTPSTPFVISVSSAPALVSVTPAEGPAAGGTLVTLAGSLFQAGAEVLFGGIPASDVQVIGPNQIACLTPPHFPAMVDVKVRNPDDSAATKLNAFRFVSSDVVLSLPDCSGDQGSVILIPLSLSNVGGFLAIEGTVVYNPAVLTAQSVNVGTLTQGWSISSNLATAGNIRFALANTSSVGGSGSVVILTFLVNGSSSAQSPLAIQSALLNDGAISWTGVNGTFTVSGRFHLGGAVRYYSGNGPVAGVGLTLGGSGFHTAETNRDGEFEFADVLTGSYTLTPIKGDDIAEITAYDASLVLQHVAGNTSLSANQIIAADVNRNGAVTTMDAVYILQKSVGLLETPFPGAGRDWDFVPGQRSYANLNADQSAQDFTAILLGDVSGNWEAPSNPDGERGMGLAGNKALPPVEILTSCIPLPGTNRHVFRLLARSTDPCIFSADLVLKCRQSTHLISSSSPASLQVNDSQPGIMRVGIASGDPLPAAGVLLTLILEDDLPPAVQLDHISLNEDGLAHQISFSLGSFDQDGDGLLDIDEVEFLNTSPYLRDSDHDGYDDLAEIIMGTDPTDPTDRFVMTTEIGIGEDPLMHIFWKSLRGRIYTVQEASTPTGPWVPVREFPGNNAIQSFAVPINGPCGFLRLAVRLEE